MSCPDNPDPNCSGDDNVNINNSHKMSCLDTPDSTCSVAYTKYQHDKAYLDPKSDIYEEYMKAKMKATIDSNLKYSEILDVFNSCPSTSIIDKTLNLLQKIKHVDLNNPELNATFEHNSDDTNNNKFCNIVNDYMFYKTLNNTDSCDLYFNIIDNIRLIIKYNVPNLIANKEISYLDIISYVAIFEIIYNQINSYKKENVKIQDIEPISCNENFQLFGFSNEKLNKKLNAVKSKRVNVPISCYEEEVTLVSKKYKFQWTGVIIERHIIELDSDSVDEIFNSIITLIEPNDRKLITKPKKVKIRYVENDINGVEVKCILEKEKLRNNANKELKKHLTIKKSMEAPICWIFKSLFPNDPYKWKQIYREYETDTVKKEYIKIDNARICKNYNTNNLEIEVEDITTATDVIVDMQNKFNFLAIN